MQAKIDGATVVAPPLDLSPELQGGYYVAPTILTQVLICPHVIASLRHRAIATLRHHVIPTQVPVESAAWTEEIFGPVLSVVAFESEAEALACRGAWALLWADFDARHSQTIFSGP